MFNVFHGNVKTNIQRINKRTLDRNDHFMHQNAEIYFNDEKAMLVTSIEDSLVTYISVEKFHMH